MPAKARCQITVRHYECDPLGHVNHAMYVHYFEVGRLTAMADAGLPFWPWIFTCSIRRRPLRTMSWRWRVILPISMGL